MQNEIDPVDRVNCLIQSESSGSMKTVERKPSKLTKMYEFQVDLDDSDNGPISEEEDNDDQSLTCQSKLFTETIERRGPSSLPPLLSRLSERTPEKLDYIGVSFGSTPSLLRFWKRAGYIPVYIRQTLVR